MLKEASSRRNCWQKWDKILPTWNFQVYEETLTSGRIFVMSSKEFSTSFCRKLQIFYISINNIFCGNRGTNKPWFSIVSLVPRLVPSYLDFRRPFSNSFVGFVRGTLIQLDFGVRICWTVAPPKEAPKAWTCKNADAKAASATQVLPLDVRKKYATEKLQYRSSSIYRSKCFLHSKPLPSAPFNNQHGFQGTEIFFFETFDTRWRLILLNYMTLN